MINYQVTDCDQYRTILDRYAHEGLGYDINTSLFENWGANHPEIQDHTFIQNLSDIYDTWFPCIDYWFWQDYVTIQVPFHDNLLGYAIPEDNTGDGGFLETINNLSDVAKLFMVGFIVYYIAPIITGSRN